MINVTTYLSIFVILPSSIFAFDSGKVVDCDDSTVIEVSRKSLCYRYGGHNIFTLIVEDADSVCDISITDLNGRRVTAKHEKTPILKWAFDSLDIAINSPDFAVSESYSPFIGELSLLLDKRKKIIKTYFNHKYTIIGNDELERRIRELESLLIERWITDFFLKYGLESFHFKKKSVQLRFGYNNVFTVRIEEGDSICNLTISDEYGRKITKEWEKIPILEWTFDNMENIIGSRYSKKKFKRKFKVKRNVSPGISELTMFEGGVGTILTHYANDKIVGNDELDSKITELKTLLHNLWEREFYAKYGLDLFLVNKDEQPTKDTTAP